MLSPNLKRSFPFLEKREMSDKVLEAISELKEQVCRLADMLQAQQERKEYQKSYYQRRKAARELLVQGLQLKNKERHCLEGPRDRRLPVAEWGKQLRRFVNAGMSAYNFLT